MPVVEIVTIVAGVSGVMFAGWRIAAYYSKLNADAHKALGDRIDANGQAIARVEGKVDTLIEMMKSRIAGVFLFAVAVVGLSPVDAAGQSGQRTPWGDPDLQGAYSFKTTTPLQRPESVGDKEFLTDEEVAAQEQAVVDRNLELLHAPPERATAGGNVGAYNNFWMEAGTRSTGRTSIISEPRNGRLPAPTPAGQRRHAAHRAAFPINGPFDSWEDVELNDRCLTWLAGPPLLPTFYNNNVMLLQTPGHVVLHVEMVHGTRIIPLDGRPGLATDVRQWLGDGRGRWDGDTLVVETRNIRRTAANASIGGADPILLRASNGSPEDTITVTERFTRIDAGTLHYEFTIDDPTTWTRSFSGELPLVALEPDEALYEYACHEGNYALPNILAGSRADEEAEAASRQ